MKILSYEINTEVPKYSSNVQIIINTINPHSYCVARTDIIFRQALEASDILLPDGVGIVYAAKFLNGEKINRITGADLHLHLLREAQDKRLRVFYMGAHPQTLQILEAKVKKEYPAVQVSTYSPPYKSEFSKDDSLQMISAVNAFSPDILFVGMTAPKQEKWVYKHKNELNARMICSIGAVFGFYTGITKRPGIFWQKIGLEWLPRLLREPKRLWRRTFISTPCFLLDVLKAKLSR